MIAGHFGFAAAVKYRAPAAPLWALMLGTAWLDVVFIPLFAAGIETITPVDGTTGGYGNGIIHADYTHSLIGALLLSAIYGAFFWRSGRAVAVTLGAVAFSHWILDLVVHRGDMPILPGDFGALPRLGFGLWRLPLLSIAIELLLVAAGAYLYWRASRRAASASGVTDTRRGDLVAWLIFGFGATVLFFDVTGLIG